ncbi:MAG: hypothetical protein IJ719_00475 [Clostridia bacterium]|nr:hypothetical protein [Clostridia bacterium]
MGRANHSREVQKLIEDVCTENDISRKRMATLLQYSSATSLDRLAQGKAGDKAIQDFLDRVEKSAENLFISQETRHLGQRIRKQLSGIETEIWMRLMELEQEPEEDQERFMVLSEGKEVPLERYVEAFDPAEIRIVGCVSKELVHSLRNCRFSCYIYHYLYEHVASINTIHEIESIFPMIYHPRYCAYVLSRRKTSTELPGDPSHLMNFILLKGKKQCEILLCVNQRCAVPAALENGERLERGIMEEIQRASISRQTPFEVMEPEADYIEYLKYCLKLEKRHSIYRFKPDIGLELIPFEIQSRSIRGGPFLEMYPDRAAAIPPMIEIQKQRYLQSVNSKNEQIHVMTDQVWEFVRTGKMSDHFWGMRPYTVEERKQILADLIGRCTGRGDFQIRFLKRKPEAIGPELICYDGEGLCFIPAATSYNLENGYAEIMTRDPEIMSSYTQFFKEWFLPEETLSPEESVQYLKKMLRSLETL